MSNINNDFERYWKHALNKSKQDIKATDSELKEFCRQMYVDIMVNMRCKK